MNQNEICEIKKRLARLKRSRCYVCHKKFGKGFVFHHRYYDGGEPDFKEDKSKYYEYVFNQIRNTPQQFYLLCRVDHWWLEKGLKRMNDGRFKRLCEVRRKSK